MIDDIKVYLKGENVSHEMEDPTVGVIMSIEPVETKDFKTGNPVKRYELGVEINKLLQYFLPNKTSMRNMMVGFGRDETKWIGKRIVLWSKERDVNGRNVWVTTVEPMPGD